MLNMNISIEKVVMKYTHFINRMIENKHFIDFLDKKKKEIYKNPDSILKEYDAFLEFNGIYHSHDVVSFRKNLKGRMELCEQILYFHNTAKLDNERLSLLEDLIATGYDKNKIVEIILEVFFSDNPPINLWRYGDMLYRLKRYKYLPEYLEIVSNSAYGSARQMVVLLLGKSKKLEVIPVLLQLTEDETVFGHAVEALANFEGEQIVNVMQKYKDCDVKWISKVAIKYLEKH